MLLLVSLGLKHLLRFQEFLEFPPFAGQIDFHLLDFLFLFSDLLQHNFYWCFFDPRLPPAALSCASRDFRALGLRLLLRRHFPSLVLCCESCHCRRTCSMVMAYRPRSSSPASAPIAATGSLRRRWSIASLHRSRASRTPFVTFDKIVCVTGSGFFLFINLFLLFLLCSFLFDPVLQLKNCFPEHGQFYMRVNVVGCAWTALGVAHERVSHVLDDTCFHQSCVEGVPQMPEQHRPHGRSTDSGIPRPAEFANGFAFVGKEQARFRHLR